MGLKEKAWLIALVGGILGLIGWCTPYIWITTGPMMMWSWGLVSIMGITQWVMSDIVFAGILIIIFAVIALATGFLAKKREELKIMGIIWLISGVLLLIGSLIPVFMGADMYLSIGFYLPLIGGIVVILAGAAALFM